MSTIYEPDFAMSFVVAPEEVDLVPFLLQKPFWLRCSEYLFRPENPACPFELVRGVGLSHAEWTKEAVAKQGYTMRVCRWDEVGSGVLRAPVRVPGFVGRSEWFGIRKGRVFDWNLPGTPNPTEVTWETQAFENHEHPGVGKDDDIETEERHIADLKSDLSALFPDRRFVIEHRPGLSVTFYEPGEDAPTESSNEWESQISPVRSDKVGVFLALLKEMKPDIQMRDYGVPECFDCGGAKIPDESESVEHPGVIFAYCANCGKRYLAACRCIRTKIGPW